jgi:alpha-beta hydrolase superfamily lysophospholipase
MNQPENRNPMGSLIGDPLPGAPELAARGGTATGVRTIEMVFPDRPQFTAGKQNGRFARGERRLKAEVWYPAALSGNELPAVYTDHMGRADLENLTPFQMTGRAFRDAAPDPEAGARPVILISHGYPGSRFLLSNLAENLSGKGYVVFSVGHTDNTYEDFPKQYSLESALVHRSMDQRLVISEFPRLNSEGFLKGLLQPDNVGVLGFSMGGYGTLRTIGTDLKADLRKQFGEAADELTEEPGWQGLRAVRAAALFAPATFFLEPAGAKNLKIPTIWFCGTADHVVYYEQVHQFWKEAVNSRRFFVSYEGCGHNVANNPAPPEAASMPWEIFKRWSDPVWDTRRLNDANNHFVTAFFDRFLRNEDGKQKYLVPAETGRELTGFTEGTSAGIHLESAGE